MIQNTHFRHQFKWIFGRKEASEYFWIIRWTNRIQYFQINPIIMWHKRQETQEIQETRDIYTSSRDTVSLSCTKIIWVFLVFFSSWALEIDKKWSCHCMPFCSTTLLYWLIFHDCSSSKFESEVWIVSFRNTVALFNCVFIVWDVAPVSKMINLLFPFRFIHVVQPVIIRGAKDLSDYP